MRESAPAPDTHFGFRTVPLDAKQRLVDDVFHKVARRYDVMNDLMSGGMHRRWKDRFVARVKPRPGEIILDMAGGTGDVAFRMARRGAHVTVADINASNADIVWVGLSTPKQERWMASHVGRLEAILSRTPP